MGSPFEIFDFKDETDWLNGRMNGIGGSDDELSIFLFSLG